MPRGTIKFLELEPDDAKIAKKRAEREMDDVRHKFIIRRWTTQTLAILKPCVQGNMSLIDIQRELLRKCYEQIPELQNFLRFDNQTGQYKSSGEFNCHLDGYALCHMNCVVSPKSREDSDESIAVTVTWNRGMKNSRVENWTLNIFTYKNRLMAKVNEKSDKRPLSLVFVSHDIHDTFSTSAAQCRDVTLVSMRACLHALTA